MSGQTLQLSGRGKKLAREALKRLGISQEKLAKRTGLSPWSISRFMTGKPVRAENFLILSKDLGLAVEQLVEEYEEPSDLSALVEEVRAKVYDDIDYRCGTMRVLDMTQPIGLGQIYTQVNILEKITGARRLGISELMEACGVENFERFGLGDIRQEKVPGLEAVQAHNRLMVLGKPGAGKTTFLKYLATQCNQGKQFKNLVPIFVTLKEFAESEGSPSLLKYVQSQLDKSKVSNPNETLESLLEGASSLILLDGLDEVKQEDARRIYMQIEDFAGQARDCVVVVTCRIAAKEYIFEQFSEVEVADFDEQQIEEFVSNWFDEKSPAKTKIFLERINKNNRVKELATSPLLLTLLCLLFEDNTDFPTNRYELYQEGVAVLLKKWDAKRSIERQEVYKKISAKRKEDLLSYVALSAFKEGEYFFKQKRLEKSICEYVRHLPEAESDPKALALDGEAVLKAIEAHHGLLVERAKGIYSFSHLTLQEYFAARQIIEDRPTAFEILINRATDKAWREIALLTVNGLSKSDDFLLSFKQHIDLLVCGDLKIQNFLVWLHLKSEAIGGWFKRAAVRVCYFSLFLVFDLDLERRDHIRVRDSSSALICALDFGFPNLDFDFPNLDLDFPNLDFDFSNLDLDFPNLDLDCTLALARASARKGASAVECGEGAIDLRFANALNRALDLVSAQEVTGPVVELLETIVSMLPKVLGETIDWFQQNGRQFINELSSLMQEHRNFGHDWQFDKVQMKTLLLFLELNQLLVDCLNTDCYVSREVRQEIEETLLLPMSKIEAYKKAHPR